MTFQPIVPFGGFAGWSFLNRTRESQQEAFNNSVEIKRNISYFNENIGKIESAEELVNNRQLLQVALGAFGLDEDINNKYFLQKILEDGTLDPRALGNRLSDKRYFEFSAAFGFGDRGVPRTKLTAFPGEIQELYTQRQFEIAIGQTDETMRLAMSLERDLGTLLENPTTDDGLWFKVMGQPPVRKVFETALGLPTSLGSLDLDIQLSNFRQSTLSRFGDSEVKQFADPEKREELIRLFIVQSQINSNAASTSPGSVALTLLQNIR